MPERLACKQIAEMHFDERYGHAQKCVAQGDAGMSERAGIDDNERSTAALGRMHLGDELLLRVALRARELMAPGEGQPGQLDLDVVKARRAVDCRFPRPEQVKIRPIQQ